MQRKTVVVTGATSGIGAVTARDLAQMGAHVIVVSRNPKRCKDTVKAIRWETGNEEVEYLLADLSSQAEVRRVAEEILQRDPSLDVLVNNVGAFFLTRRESIDGIEMTLALNHLSNFLLTNLLLDRIKATAGEHGEARIVNVASAAHRGAHIHFDDLQFRRGYNGMAAYGQSKLANILFTYELARQLEGTAVTVNALHPGFVASNFAKNNGLLVKLAMNLAGLFGNSPEKGARTSVYLASSPEVRGVSGKYFVKKKAVSSSPESYNKQTAERLWQMSEALTSLVKA
jgi:NAD(P)-dependent dehydrogenase (short-subunit alcohol dehydrogenase family)